MFRSPEETLVNLERVGYFTDRKTATTVFLAGRIHRPVMLEGPAGAGKTQLAQSVARAYGAPFLRLQCYQGVNEEKAIGQYDKSLQELYVLLMSKSSQAPDWEKIEQEITSRTFFMAGPLLEAIEQEQPCVLLIDEIDKVDYAFESWQSTIRTAKSISNIQKRQRGVQDSFNCMALTSGDRQTGHSRALNAIMCVRMSSVSSRHSRNPQWTGGTGDRTFIVPARCGAWTSGKR
jgi:hypothetical protein